MNGYLEFNRRGPKVTRERLALLEDQISALAPEVSQTQRDLSEILEARDRVKRGDLKRRREEYERSRSLARGALVLVCD